MLGRCLRYVYVKFLNLRFSLLPIGIIDGFAVFEFKIRTPPLDDLCPTRRGQGLWTGSSSLRRKKKRFVAVDIRGRNPIGTSRTQVHFVVHFLRCVTLPLPFHCTTTACGRCGFPNLTISTRNLL